MFVRSSDLYLVSAAGGEPELLLDGDSLGGAEWPHLLPTGDAVVFSTNTQGAPETAKLFVFDLDTRQVRELGPLGNNPRYVPTGHLLFGHATRALMAVPFDMGSKEITGDPSIVLPDVWVNNTGATQFTVSDNGTALYAISTATVDPTRQLAVVDRIGQVAPLPLRQGAYNSPRYSPDGRSIVYEAGGQIWLYNPLTGRNAVLTPKGTASTRLGPEMADTSISRRAVSARWIATAFAGLRTARETPSPSTDVEARTIRWTLSRTNPRTSCVRTPSS